MRLGQPRSGCAADGPTVAGPGARIRFRGDREPRGREFGLARCGAGLRNWQCCPPLKNRGSANGPRRLPRPGVTEVKAPNPAGRSGAGGGVSDGPGWAKSPATNSVLQVNEPSCQQLNSASAGQTERTIKIKSQFSLNEIWDRCRIDLCFRPGHKTRD